MLGLGLSLAHESAKNKTSILITNLISNGDFPNITNWNVQGLANIITSRYKYTPSSLQVVSGGYASYAYTNISNAANRKYYVGVWYMRVSGSGALCAVLPYGLVSGAIGTPLSVSEFDATTTGVWNYKSGIYTSTATGITVLCGRNNAASFDAGYDGIVVMDVTASTLTEAQIKAQLDTLIANSATYVTSGYLTA